MTKHLTIGIAGPFTGPRSAYGDLIRAAVSHAQQMDATWFTPVFGDDKAQVPEAERVAQQFTRAGVDAVVGHFNSDCARAAGAIYREARLPFLMPASTADDLSQTTDGIRICAADAMQVDAIARWLGHHDESLAEIWEDGSPYAARLGSALRARDLLRVSTDPERPRAFLGAHHAVALELQERQHLPGPVIVPDDCAIEEFDDLLHGLDVDILCPLTQPSFAACVGIALDLLRDAAHSALPLAAALDRQPSLWGRQYTQARFTLHMSHHRAETIRGIAS